MQTAPLCQGTTTLTGQPRLLTGCVENRRWTFHKVTFATLNVQGSCNILCSSGAGDPGGDVPEYTAREAANELWLHETFAEAKAQGSAGVMIIWQADPGFDLSGFQGAPRRNPTTLDETDGNPDGVHDLLSRLRDETIAFQKPRRAAGQVPAAQRHEASRAFRPSPRRLPGTPPKAPSRARAWP